MPKTDDGWVFFVFEEKRSLQNFIQTIVLQMERESVSIVQVPFGAIQIDISSRDKPKMTATPDLRLICLVHR